MTKQFTAMLTGKSRFAAGIKLAIHSEYGLDYKRSKVLGADYEDRQFSVQKLKL